MDFQLDRVKSYQIDWIENKKQTVRTFGLDIGEVTHTSTVRGTQYYSDKHRETEIFTSEILDFLSRGLNFINKTNQKDGATENNDFKRFDKLE